MCHELISVQHYLLLIIRRIIFVTAGSLSHYLIRISHVVLSEAASSPADLFLSHGCEDTFQLKFYCFNKYHSSND